MSSDDAADLGREVKALLDQRRYEGALSSAEHFASVAPQSARAWLAVGLAQRGLGHLPEALQAVDKAISLDATLAAPWQVQGVILVKLQRCAEAAQALRQALERAPSEGSVWAMLGFALQHQFLNDEALASYDQAWQLHYQTAEVLYGQISTLSALGRYAEALSRAEEYVLRFPQDVSAWRLRAGMLHALERYEEALADFAQARQLEAPTPEVLEAEITAYCALHRFAEALPLSEEYVRLAPDDVSAWGSHAAVLEGLRRHEEAIAAYDRALALQPDLLWALERRASALWRSGRRRQALRALLHASAVSATKRRAERVRRAQQPRR